MTSLSMRPSSTTTSANGGASSPNSSSLPSSSPSRPKFDTTQLSSYVQKLLTSLLTGKTWDQDKDRSRSLVQEIGARVKERMLVIEPTGFKFIVIVNLNENLGQGGRAGMSSHWEESDQSLTELWSNDSLVCVVSAFAVRCY
ncbi:hypothetical protein BDY24DRAFT_403248 [Mrakia frigida]|uniref:Tctex-type family dynein light chain n=1 Tax=Mrakia frigida TaxID=29902 RepID=UPI003FCC26E4